MLIFGHTGITAGIFQVCDLLMKAPGNSDEPNPGSRFGIAVREKRLTVYHLLSGMRNQLDLIDYRLILSGSLLPDILDKPLWLFAFSDIFPSGRGYGHTFIFNLVFFICGLILIRQGKSWLLVISLSGFIHLLLDRMWSNPVTLWWPLLGQFQRRETIDWIPNILHKLFTDIAPRFVGRPGGYTRILKIGNRLGDSAEMVLLELVQKKEEKKKPKKKKGVVKKDTSAEKQKKK